MLQYTKGRYCVGNTAILIRLSLEAFTMPMIRLDKLLSDSGLFTRSEARATIRAGRVTVDGSVVRSPEEKYDAETAEIRIDGARINCVGVRYLMMNKPTGVLSATDDPRQKTVLDLLPPELRKQRLFPVGRLDKDTTGLLLLTNDGAFAHRVISPKQHVPKRYRAELDGPLGAEDAAAFAEGIVLSDGTVCLPARLELADALVGIVTVYEGKYHQVKRMVAARGRTVLALHRESIGALRLDETLLPGGYRELRPDEIEAVFRETPCAL